MSGGSSYLDVLFTSDAKSNIRKYEDLLSNRKILPKIRKDLEKFRVENPSLFSPASSDAAMKSVRSKNTGLLRHILKNPDKYSTERVAEAMNAYSSDPSDYLSDQEMKEKEKKRLEYLRKDGVGLEKKVISIRKDGWQQEIESHYFSGYGETLPPAKATDRFIDLMCNKGIHPVTKEAIVRFALNRRDLVRIDRGVIKHLSDMNHEDVCDYIRIAEKNDELYLDSYFDHLEKERAADAEHVRRNAPILNSGLKVKGYVTPMVEEPTYSRRKS